MAEVRRSERDAAPRLRRLSAVGRGLSMAARSEVGEIDVTRPETLVLAIAARQHGVVTTAQLLAAGWSRDAISGRRGWLRRLHRGVYLVGPVEAEHSRAAAAVLAAGEMAVLSHSPAAVVWGLRPPDEGPLHVTI